jgi:hypothetical protein
MQKWVIWGLDTKGEIIFHTRTCKKPNRTKEYKDLAKQFSKGTLDKFGFMSYTEYEKGNYWLDCFNQYKVLETN